MCWTRASSIVTDARWAEWMASCWMKTGQPPRLVAILIGPRRLGIAYILPGSVRECAREAVGLDQTGRLGLISVTSRMLIQGPASPDDRRYGRRGRGATTSCVVGEIAWKPMSTSLRSLIVCVGRVVHTAEQSAAGPARGIPCRTPRRRVDHHRVRDRSGRTHGTSRSGRPPGSRHEPCRRIRRPLGSARFLRPRSSAAHLLHRGVTAPVTANGRSDVASRSRQRECR